MTIWTPDLARHAGPKYLALAQAMAEAIAAGDLKGGDRLPTHRDLAHRLGVTVGTVSRAYAEADRRGLTRGEVGRGTYVRGGEVRSESDLPLSLPVEPETSHIDMRLNIPSIHVTADAVSRTLAALSRDTDLEPLVRYLPGPGLPRHRRTGAQWLKRSGVSVDPASVFVTCGAQHAMLAALMAVARPGERIVTENLCFPGFKSLCEQLGWPLEALPLDDEGIRPDALEEACRRQRPAALYIVPTHQNPTTATLSEDRRRALAAIARRYDLPIIEDDEYGAFPAHRPPAIQAFAPDQTLLLASTSKIVGGGLRVGFAAVPERWALAYEAAVRATVWSGAPLTVELVHRWIEDGTADALIARHRDASGTVYGAAEKLLPPGSWQGSPSALNIWLKPTASWTDNALAAELSRRGVLALTSEAFTLGPDSGAEQGLRLCHCNAGSTARAIEGLRIVADVLAGRPEPLSAVI